MSRADGMREAARIAFEAGNGEACEALIAAAQFEDGLERLKGRARQAFADFAPGTAAGGTGRLGDTICPDCGIPYESDARTIGCEGCEEADAEGLKPHAADCICDWCEKR